MTSYNSQDLYIALTKSMDIKLIYFGNGTWINAESNSELERDIIFKQQLNSYYGNFEITSNALGELIACTRDEFLSNYYYSSFSTRLKIIWDMLNSPHINIGIILGIIKTYKECKTNMVSVINMITEDKKDKLNDLMARLDNKFQELTAKFGLNLNLNIETMSAKQLQ